MPFGASLQSVGVGSWWRMVSEHLTLYWGIFAIVGLEGMDGIPGQYPKEWWIIEVVRMVTIRIVRNINPLVSMRPYLVLF